MHGLMGERLLKRFLKGIRRKSKTASANETEPKSEAETTDRSNDLEADSFQRKEEEERIKKTRVRKMVWIYRQAQTNRLKRFRKQNERRRIMNWVTIIGGAILFIAPFVAGYSGTPWALWTSLIMGAVIAVLGFMQSYKWAAVAGLVTFIAPFVLGFSGIGAALWTGLIVGGVVAIMDGYRGFFLARPA